jgi:pilus assembly protein CpaC
MIAMNGQEANFLAGGEFPVPIVQSDGERTRVVIEWKEYGVKLRFKPTIIDEDHIRLELEPEVSTIDFSNGVKFQGYVIPGLKTRKSKTGIELRDGQSFMLGGLLDNNEIKTISRTPLLASIPVLGNLFKSKSFQKQETELMFIVTAQIVKPVNRDDLPQMRGLDGLKKGSVLGVEPKGEGINGQSGFSVPGGTSEAKPADKSRPAVNAPERSIPASLPASSGNATSSATSLHAGPALAMQVVQPAQLKPVDVGPPPQK